MRARAVRQADKVRRQIDKAAYKLVARYLGAQGDLREELTKEIRSVNVAINLASRGSPLSRHLSSSYRRLSSISYCRALVD